MFVACCLLTKKKKNLSFKSSNKASTMNVIQHEGALSHTPICVDNFTSNVSNHKTTYFLTHAHHDHIQGLTNAWNAGPVYCSHTTLRITRNKFPELDMSQWRAISVGETTTIKLEGTNNSINVTLFDSFHCAGSVMFLFEGRFGRVLHTGDFRFESDLLNDLFNSDDEEEEEEEEEFSFLSTIKHNQIIQKPINCLYLDNTYSSACDNAAAVTAPKNNKEAVVELPTRKQMLTLLSKAVVNKYSSNTKFYVVLDQLGKEEIVWCVANALKSNVLVNQQRFEMFASIFSHGGNESDGNVSALFEKEMIQSMMSLLVVKEDNNRTTCNDDIRVEVVFKRHLEALLPLPENSVVLYASGSFSARSEEEIFQPGEIRLPYTLHSTKKEIELFLEKTKPLAMVPIVHTTTKDVTSLKQNLFTEPSVTWDEAQANGKRKNKRKKEEEEEAIVFKPKLQTSPNSKRRRKLHQLKIKQLRRVKRKTNEEVLRVLSRGTVNQPWTKEEDLFIAQLIKAKKHQDEALHLKFRNLLGNRTDEECAMRCAYFNTTLH